MNLDTIPQIARMDPKRESAVSFITIAEGVERAHRVIKCRSFARNSRGLCRTVILITGVALCMGLGSCVVPYDSEGGDSVTISSYSPGYRVNSLPSGYRSEDISGSTYYYHDGQYYNKGSGGYVIVDAPRNSRYYDDYSRRQRSHHPDLEYRESSDSHDQRYDRGEVITRLPSGYRELNHRGNTFYQVGDRYYRRQGEQYVIVSRPN